MYKGKTLIQNNITISEPVSSEVVKGIVGGFIVVGVIWGMIWMFGQLVGGAV